MSVASSRKKLTVGLISHPLEDDNLGCVALAISNIILIDQAAERAGLSVVYRVMINEKQVPKPLSFTSSEYEYCVYSSSKQTLRHPLRLLKSPIFDGCDLVININGGDGYTDLYGFPRLLSESYMNVLATLHGKKVLMAPQTIGPFEKKSSKLIARAVLNRCERIYSRDQWSTQLCKDIQVRPTVEEVIDVAFALPFSKGTTRKTEKPQIGVNVSGLLYRGGYDRQNYFRLAFDYKEYIHALVSRLIDNGYEPHLVAHVIASSNEIEDDYSAARTVRELYPQCVLAPKFTSPIDAKTYIAQLDFFTGARMHSTIAAFASGVPVVPMGYSKKVAGLYETLEYPFIIDARESRWSAESVVSQTLEWIDSRDLLRSSVEKSSLYYRLRLEEYCNSMKDRLSACVPGQ